MLYRLIAITAFVATATAGGSSSYHTRKLAKKAKSSKSKKSEGKNKKYVEVKTSPLEPGENICEGTAAAELEVLGLTGDITCTEANARNIGQTGTDVTVGYTGDLDVRVTPSTEPFANTAKCPVNVHMHIGAEHSSDGQYDIKSDRDDFFDFGPTYDTVEIPAYNGKRCRLYNKDDSRFTTQYHFQHCVDVKVGETYEIHWPHSSVGACGKHKLQYQNPFPDGIFCNPDNVDLSGLSAQDIANNVGVQAQIFTIINDEDYYFPDLIDGMLIDEERGVEITAYTGSRTGRDFDDEVSEMRCDDVSPVTWHVDRVCHLLSASALDELCRDMKEKPGMRQCGEACNNMPDYGVDKEGCCFPDAKPGLSRGVVDDGLAADNHVNLADP
ncbi:MAG: hypothetical protein SGILL_009805 [Bacillariaceae sp.]